ncbi:MAG: hypothetical protein IOC82_12335 [Aestuariivirga sp.]|uniref:hypothetical protein n=1 Tax=Aestuariivirga sp. TaxID=2650926 RepID=UPI0025C0D1BD|nr:hypothetical protein [Aestuariivirga sp.]MCA3561806.1 hypothetical protein [Aestuariivirga sp.]
MAKLTIRTDTQEIAINAVSDGPGLVAETSSAAMDPAISGVASNPGGGGAGLIGQTFGSGAGVVGLGNDRGLGGFFQSVTRGALVCETRSAVEAAAAVFQKNPAGVSALHVEHITDGTAAFFKGNVIVTGDVSFPGADCAEEFVIADAAPAEPGSVMVMAADGRLLPCTEAYDRAVAGVVAGAGDLRPGIVMGRDPADTRRRSPIALVGRTFCKVDAAYGAIATGDLLTSSATPGHAMKAADPARAFGAVIGKAMAPHAAGTGLIPILVALQ